MKILSEDKYKDLLREIDDAEESLNKEILKNNDLKRKIEVVSLEKATAVENTVELLRKIDNLKEKMKLMELSVSRLSSKLRRITGRCGGLTKHNNKLLAELQIAKERINNYRLYSRKNHVKMTVNQYDKRLPSVNTVRNK